MKKILLLALPLMVMCAVSCERPQENNTPEEIIQGSIDAIATYNGDAPYFWCNYYVCDMSQLDMIATYAQQIHEAEMGYDSQEATDLSNDFMYRLQYLNNWGNNVYSADSRFFYNIDPGTYVLLAERRVLYLYYQTPDDLYPSTGDVFRYQYEVVQVKSDQITRVAFEFQDYTVYLK